MASDGKVTITIDLDGAKAQGEVKSLKGLLQSLGSASTTALGSGAKSILGFGAAFAVASKVVNSALGAISSSMSGAVSRVDTMNRFPKMMEAMGFSAQDAKSSIDELSKGIDGLPTALDEVVGTTQQLALMNGDLSKSTKLTLALNDAFLASGSSSADASRGLTQFSQMMSSGKVDMQSWKTLMETMPLGLQKTAEAFGFAGASAKNDLYEALKKGTITFDQFSDKLIELDGGLNGFAQLARVNSIGIATSFKNIKTAVVRGVANMIQAFDKAAQAAGLGGIAENLNKVKSAVSSAFNAINGQIGKFVNTAVSTFKKIFNNKSLVSLETALHSAKTAIDAVKDALSAGINSGGWIFTAQIAVKTAISVFSNASLAVAKFVNAFAETGAIANFRMMINNILETVQSVVKKFNDSDVASGLGTAFGNLVKTASNAFAELGKSINWDNVISTFSTVATTLMNIASAIIPALTKGFVAVVNVLAAIGSSSSFQLLAKGVELVVQEISKLVQGIADFFAKTNGAAVDTGVIFAGLAALVAKVFGGGIRNSIGIVKGSISGLLSHIPIIGRLFKSSGNVAQQAMGKAAGATGKSVSKIAQIINSLGNILKSAGQAISTAFRGIGSSIATVLKGLGSSIASIFQSLGAGIATAAKGIGSGLSTAFQGIGKAISMMNPATVLAIAAAILAVGAAFALAGSQGEGIKTMLEGFGSLIESVGAAISNFVSTVILSFAQALAIVIPSLAKLSPLVTAVGQAFATVITAIGGVAPQLGVLVSSIGTAIAEIISSVSELVSAFAPIVEIMANTFVRVVEVVMSAMPQIISALTPLAQIFSTTFIEITRIVSQAIVQIVQALAPFIPAISEMVTALAPVLQSLVDAFNNLISQIRPIIDSITNLFKTLGEQIRNILDGAKGVIEGFGGAVRNILDGIAGIFDSIGNAALNAGKGFKELAKGVVMITDTNLADMAASLGAVATGVAAIASSGAGLASAGAGMTALGTGMMALATSSTMALTSLQMLPSVFMSLQMSLTTFPAQLTLAQTAMMAFGTSVTATVSGLMTSVSTLTNFTMQVAMMTPSLMMASAGLSGFNAQANAAGNAMRLLASNSSVAQGQVTALGVSIQVAMSGATASISTAGNQMVVVIQSSMMQLSMVVTNSMINASSAVLNGSMQMSTSIRTAGTQMITTMQSAINTVVNTVNNGRSRMISAGQYMSEGLAVGMRNALPAVTAAANALVAEAERAAQAKAKINSPSHLFRDEVGWWIGAGVAKGIDQSTVKVDEAMTDMYSKINAFSFKPENILGVGKTNISHSVTAKVMREQAMRVTADDRKSQKDAYHIQNNNLLENLLDKVYDLEALIEKGKKIVLDSGTLVGETKDIFDEAIGSNTAMIRRHRL